MAILPCPTRRDLLRGTPALLAATLGARSQPPPRYRAAIIGRTGGGDYGHGYDRVFADLNEVSVVAVADPDATGRDAAMTRSGAPKGYASTGEMLAAEKPDLVAITFRQPQGHREAALACIQAGVRGLFLEKPFTRTPAEADEVLAAAERAGTRIVVAHTRRVTAAFAKARALVSAGRLGVVRDVRMEGKQDARAGGEDLMVLGTHDFDLLRWWFGDPRWCMAHVESEGRDAGPADVHPGREGFAVAGDRIFATFGFANGVRASWSSMRTSDHWNTDFQRPREKWSFEVHGTRAILAYASGPDFGLLESPFLAYPEGGTTWKALPEPDGWTWPEHERHLIRSLIHAIETGGQPVCSGRDAAWAVEMVAAVHQSHALRARVDFPLRDRTSGLATAP